VILQGNLQIENIRLRVRFFHFSIDREAPSAKDKSF